MEAERSGWAILEGVAETVGVAARLRDFADFGCGSAPGDIQREPSADDPHVVIPALSTEIPPILLDVTVQDELRQRLGSIWPPPPDMGLSVYQEALVLVQTLLRSSLNGDMQF